MAAEEEVKDGESMEDILSSIRDIIVNDNGVDNDDEGESNDMAKDDKSAETEETTEAEAPAEEKDDATPAEEAQDDAGDDEVLELTEEVDEDAEAPAEDDTTDDADDAAADVLDDIDAAIAEEKPEKKEAPAAKEPANTDASPDKLVSENAAAAASDSLKNLMNSVPREQVESKEFRNGNTLEDLVVEAITPMLADWLDDNLPTIVERLVEKEIRKLVPND